MKCPICSTQNPDGATTCQQCGFGLSLSEEWWPDASPNDVSKAKPVSTPAEAETPTPSPADWADRVDATESPLDNNALARLHIAKGFEAVRNGAPDLARQEFERARHLADDPDVVRLAQNQLDALDEAAVPTPPAVPEPDEPGPEAVVESDDWDEPADEVVQPPVEWVETPSPEPALADLPGLEDWSPILLTGLIFGLANAALSGCGAVCCAGLVLSPLMGFLAGWRATYQIRQAGYALSTGQALVVGLVVGLGGWVGELIGHPLWLANNTGTPNDVSLCIACLFGSVYAVLPIPMSALGWRVGAR